MIAGSEHVRVESSEGVAVAIIDHLPVNLMTVEVMFEIAAFGQAAAADSDTRVVVLRSDTPDFFIAHFDVEAILAVPTEGEPKKKASRFSDLCDQFRRMPKATIAQIEGRAGGGGCELALAMDMRFGVIGESFVSQKEASIGLLAGGGGTQRLPRIIGRGRALEMLLGCYDIDAETAERWGWFNRVLPVDQIDTFVQNLAHRIALMDPEAIALTKGSVDYGDQALRDGLAEESYLFDRLCRNPASRKAMEQFVRGGGQAREAEFQRFPFENLVRER